MELRKFFLKVVVRKPGNAIPLSLAQHREVPCLSLSSYEYEEKLFGIEFRPQKGVSDEKVAQVHIEALSKEFDIHKWELLKEE